MNRDGFVRIGAWLKLSHKIKTNNFEKVEILVEYCTVGGTKKHS